MFLESSLLLEETHWTLARGSGVPGVPHGVAHTFKDATGFPSPLQPPDSLRWEPYR